MRTILVRAIYIFALFQSLSAKTQNIKIDSLINIQTAVDPQEKIFVHFDRKYYNPGETIWFKAYLFTGLEPSAVSKNFYTEIRDENGKLLDRKTAPIFMSGASGSFVVDSNYKKSTIFFRAYTVEMLNGDTSFIYVQPIRVIVPPKKITAAQFAQYQTTKINFLPEGGDLVTGLQSTVAFKAVSGADMPANVTGYIKASDGTTIANFASVHDGMGVFTITPEANKTYTAVWKDKNKKEYNTLLPIAKPSGIVLHVSDLMGGKYFSIERREDATEDEKELKIVAIMGQQTVYDARINMSNKSLIETTIPTAEFPTGLLTITVFNKKYIPLAERICFVNNSNYEFDADAWISDFNSENRALNRAEIKISDTFMVNCSISITDADLDPPMPLGDNIVTHMLFTGDLRGEIYQPYYYFYNTSDSAVTYLDMVMLTNGWRRYNWAKIMAGNVAPKKYIESNYLSIAGQVIGNGFSDGLQLNGLIFTGDSSRNFIMLPISRTGKVEVDGMLFYDSAKLFLNFSDKRRTFDASMFNVNNGLLQGNYTMGFAQAMQRANLADLDSALMIRNLRKNSDALKIAAKRFKDAHELQNVIVKGKIKTDVEKLDERYASGMFSGGTGRRLDVMNDPFAIGGLNIFQYLQGKVAGLQIAGDFRVPTLMWRGGTPTIFLNEIQTNADQVASLSINDVAYIKAFPPGEGGVISNSGGGAIAIYTKRGGDVSSSQSGSSSIVSINGYSPIKEFYAPDYSKPSPDNFYDNLNATLYWDPEIIFGKDKRREKIQFYNNDITKRFKLVMEGIDENGKLFHTEKVVEQ